MIGMARDDNIFSAYLVVVVPFLSQPVGCFQVSQALDDIQRRIIVVPSKVVPVKQHPSTSQ